MVSQIFEGINDYNIGNPSAKMRKLRPEDHIDVIKMSHMPFIGKALAQTQNRQFLDDEKERPLNNMVYAAIFASLELEKYYRT
ncbi:hypothetical protein [Mucilaginibacter aquatilis]|uniref:Uncharacterized protein n=1 Tax=Mucilaginibacter aquatilis TaxID=1517760 RepID=A0A6I4I5V2_9SPHI|nr:hypothetical protein [Mucilaginibacter aquatilis]MVN90500.1 hypothetical protein [Mucilaginibacter aquatilis]